MKKRVGEIEEFEFDAISDEKDLHIAITISGWLTKDTLSKTDLWLIIITIYPSADVSSYLMKIQPGSRSYFKIQPFGARRSYLKV